MCTQGQPFVKQEVYRPPFIYLIPGILHKYLYPKITQDETFEFYYCYNQAKFYNIVKDLAYIENHVKVNENKRCIDKFYCVVFDAFETNVPKIILSTKDKEFKDTWMNPELKRLINKITGAHIKEKKCGYKYRALRQPANRNRPGRLASNNYFQTLENSLLGDSKLFWSFYNKQKECKGVHSLNVHETTIKEEKHGDRSFQLLRLLVNCSGSV